MIDLLHSGPDKRLDTCRNNANDDSEQSRDDEHPQTDLLAMPATVEVHKCTQEAQTTTLSRGHPHVC
jgi:hypothetical protein